MKSKKLAKSLVSAAFAASAFLAAPANAEEWKPAEPVTIIVPWSAGGSTDTVTRVVAGELSKAFGQNFVIINQPGASGSVGTRAVWEAPHDGMTMAQRRKTELIRALFRSYQASNF